MKTTSNKTPSSRRTVLLSLLCMSALPASAQLYWDTNADVSGAGATPTGTWNLTNTFWNADPLGGSPTELWTNGSVAAFSAGSDAAGEFTVTLSGTFAAPGTAAGGLIIEEGIVNFGGGTVNLGAGPIVVAPGATLSSNSSQRISTTAGSTLTLDSSTLRTTNAGAAGTFFDVDTEIILGPGGGTLSHVTAGILNIVQTATRITGTGSLTKTGAGVLAIASTAGNNTYSGGTIVADGELRMRTVVNTLPITTAMTVTLPGIFNLNGISTQIGSLTGDGRVGLGNGTLTVGDANSTVFTGTIQDTANAGASGTTTVGGSVTKVGSGTLVFFGLNSHTGTTTLNAGSLTIESGASLSGPTANLTVNSGTLTLNNAAQGIKNLAGTGGTITLATGHVLTTDPAASTTFGGVIAGPGGLAKLNVLSGATNRTLTLTGANTYDGITTVSGGVLSVGNATALGSTLGDTEVAGGAEVLFTGATTNFTTNEPFRISGAGGPDNGAIAIIASAAPTLAGPITLIGDATVTVSSTSTGIFSNAAAFTSLAGQSLTLQGGAGAGGGGTISGAIALGAGSLTKLQGGNWTLSGVNTWTGATDISAGTLTLTGSITGTSVVNVSGTLGGTGTITPASAGNINILAQGRISPGTSVGVLSTVLSGGGRFDVSGAVAATNSQALAFELDTVASSDRVNVTGGSLEIGAAALEFDDFAFTTLAGFGEGDYVLFDGNAPISGSLGAVRNGTLGAFLAEIGFADGGNDLTLHVIPEPGSAALILGGLALLATRRRR